MSDHAPFTCFKCNDGYTPLYCLNCANAENAALQARLDACVKQSAALFIAAEDGREILEKTVRAIGKLSCQLSPKAQQDFADELAKIWDEEKMLRIRKTVIDASTPVHTPEGRDAT